MDDAINQLQSILAEKYIIKSQIASGGMGMVFLGVHRSLNKPVAIKIIHQSYRMDQDSRKRFHREARLAANLNHKGIIDIYDFGSSRNFDYIIMPFIQGQTLEEKVVTEGAFPAQRALPMMMAMVDALVYAHEHSVIHRDIKPSNFLIDVNNQIVLTDFGISKNLDDDPLTSVNTIMGSPRYMSPEQILGNDMDPRSDLYALGLIFFEMVTGRHPFHGKKSQALAYAHAHEIPVSPRKINSDIPDCLANIILKLIEKFPDQRYSEARLLKYDLEECQRRILSSEFVKGKTNSPDLYQLDWRGEQETRIIEFRPEKDAIGVSDTEKNVTPALPDEELPDGIKHRMGFWIVSILVGIAGLGLTVGAHYFLTPVLLQIKKDSSTQQPITIQADSPLRLFDQVEKNRELINRLAAVDGPVTAQHVEEIFPLIIGILPSSSNGLALEEKLDRFLATFPQVSKIPMGHCDLLLRIETLPEHTHLIITSHLAAMDMEKASTETILIKGDGLPTERIARILYQYYCIQLFEFLKVFHNHHFSDQFKKIQVFIPEHAQQLRIGDTIRMCLVSRFDAFGLLLNINLDGIYLLWPWHEQRVNHIKSGETKCSINLEVDYPAGVELVATIAMVRPDALKDLTYSFNEKSPFFQWRYPDQEPVSNSSDAIHFCQALIARLINLPVDQWASDSMVIEIIDDRITNGQDQKDKSMG